MWQTATHCITLQHTATHCNKYMLQCVTFEWYTLLQCVAVCCSVMQCVAVCYIRMRYLGFREHIYYSSTRMRRPVTFLAESFTLSLFVYPHFVCTTFAVPWLFTPWKKGGWGVVSWSYVTSCPSEHNDFGQTRTPHKWPENLANPFSDALAIVNFASWRRNFFHKWHPLSYPDKQPTWQVAWRVTCQTTKSAQV